MLQVVSSLLHAMPFDDRDASVAAMEGRLEATRRAHSLLAGARWADASLREFAMSELGHLAECRAGARLRVTLCGPATVWLCPEAAQGMSMVLHELATNAAKYSALSTADVTVEVAWTAAACGGVALCWSERGGPPAGALPTQAGFGSRLIKSLARSDLRGGAEFRWRPEGLLVEVTVAAERLEGQV